MNESPSPIKRETDKFDFNPDKIQEMNAAGIEASEMEFDSDEDAAYFD